MLRQISGIFCALLASLTMASAQRDADSGAGLGQPPNRQVLTTTDQPAGAYRVAANDGSASDATDETKAQAQRSEQALNRAERKELQSALAWEGFYDDKIDGAFGPNTRAAMEKWQAQNNAPATGVLTTAQRAKLMGAYHALFAGLDFKAVNDVTAGINLTVPLGLVKFGKYAAPFVYYDPYGDSKAQVVLISQKGDQAALQTLLAQIQKRQDLPATAQLEITEEGFTLMGQNGGIVSQTQVWLNNGAIKGFTLNWPAGDEKRRAWVWQKMATSFRPFTGKWAQHNHGTDHGKDQWRLAFFGD